MSEFHTIDQFFANMTAEERASYAKAKARSQSFVIGKIVLPEVEPPCTHDWGNPGDDWNGVYRCKKCGKYSA